MEGHCGPPDYRLGADPAEPISAETPAATTRQIVNVDALTTASKEFTRMRDVVAHGTLFQFRAARSRCTGSTR